MSNSNQPQLWPTIRRFDVARTALAVGVIALATNAVAQDQTASEFSAQRFEAPAGPRNFITTRGARTQGEMAFSAGLALNYGNRPIVANSCVATGTNTDCSTATEAEVTEVNVVEHVFTAALLGSLTPIPRVQIGLRVPLTFVEGDGLTATGTTTPGGNSAFGFGDAEIEGKFRILGEADDPMVFGASAFVSLPLGNLSAPGQYLGNGSLAGGLRGIADFDFGAFGLAANLGGTFRESATIGTASVGSEILYGVAGSFEATPIVTLILDGFGATKFSDEPGTNTLELDGAARLLPLESAWAFTLGPGVGVVPGLGVPVVRVFGSISYSIDTFDSDEDGIENGEDECPDAAEDADGFEDTDGCPDLDNDDDAFNDVDDKCPNAEEDEDKFQDDDGCPEDDNDGDGIGDVHDRCPNEPETKNQYRDDDGCPDVPDTDLDGIVDDKDQCPNNAEDTDGFNDTDGCPDLDNDADGFPDSEDECVDEPGAQGSKNGCPKKPAKQPPPPTPAPPR